MPTLTADTVAVEVLHCSVARCIYKRHTRKCSKRHSSEDTVLIWAMYMSIADPVILSDLVLWTFLRSYMTTRLHVVWTRLHYLLQLVHDTVRHCTSHISCAVSFRDLHIIAPKSDVSS